LLDDDLVPVMSVVLVGLTTFACPSLRDDSEEDDGESKEVEFENDSICFENKSMMALYSFYCS